MGPWDSIDHERPPGVGIGMVVLAAVIGLLLLGVGWLAITTFLSLLTSLTQLS